MEKNMETAKKYLELGITILTIIATSCALYFGLKNDINLIGYRLDLHVSQDSKDDIVKRVSEIEKVLPVILSKLNLTSYKESQLHNS